jgi:LPS export ABC transporter protein LptC
LVLKKIDLILFFLIAIIVSTNCKKQKALQVGDEDKEKGATITIRNFNRVSLDSKGELNWELKANETYYFLKEDKTVFYGVEFDQYEKKKLKTKVKADKGELFKKEDKVFLWGNIFVKTTDGKILEADEAVLDNQSSTLTSEGKVVIKSGGTVIRGTGLEADNKLNKFTVLKPDAISYDGINPINP